MADDTDLTAHTRATIERHWALANARRWDDFAALIAPDLQYEVPQTRECIVSGAGYIEMFRTWPGPWQAAIRTLVCEGPRAVCAFDFVTDTETMPGISIVTLRGGRIAAITEYWPAPYEPPPRATPHLQRRPA